MKRILCFACMVAICQGTHADSGLETSGNILHLAIPTAALVSSIIHEPDYDGAIQLVKSVGVSRVAVESLKFAFPNERPDHSGDDAFPSGHSADTFAAATFIQRRYGWRWAVPAYMAALYVGYTRVESDKHENEDVLAGAAIGIASGLIFSDRYSGVSISPVVDAEGGVGVSFNAIF